MPQVRDFMATKLTVLAPDDEVMAAMRTLIEHEISGAPVVDAHGNLVGLLTQRDCLTVAYQSAYHGEKPGRVRDYMTSEVETVPAEMELVEAIERFYESPYRRFPVVAESQLVGLLSRRDVLRAVLEMV